MSAHDMQRAYKSQVAVYSVMFLCGESLIIIPLLKIILISVYSGNYCGAVSACVLRDQFCCCDSVGC
jgi:hypothetical protein